MKKILYISFGIILLLALGYAGFLFRQKSVVKADISIFNLIPSDAIAIAYTNKGPFFFNDNLGENQVYKQLSHFSAIANVTTQSTVLDSLTSQFLEDKHIFDDNEFCMSWHPVGIDMTCLFILQLQSNTERNQLENLLFSEGNSLQCLKKEYNDTWVYTVTSEGDFKGISFAVIEGCLVGSSSSILLEQVAGHITNGQPLLNQPEFNEVYKTAGKNAEGNIYINYGSLAEWLKFHLDNDSKAVMTYFHRFARWGELDLNLSDESILLNGFSNFAQSDYLALFQSERAIENEISSVLPTSTSAYIGLGIENATSFRTTYENYLKSNDLLDTYTANIKVINRNTDTDVRSMFDNLLDNEIVRGYGLQNPSENNGFIVMKLKSKSEAEDEIKQMLHGYARKKSIPYASLTQYVNIDKDFGYVSYQLPYSKLFKELYGDLFGGFDKLYVTLHDNYLFAAQSNSVLSDIIYNNVLKRTLADDPNFKKFKSNLAASSNVMVYCSLRKFIDLSNTTFIHKVAKEIEDNKEHLEKIQAVAIQLSAGGKMTYVNCFTNYNPNQVDQPQTLWQSKLDTSFVQKPALVTNHYTGEKEICVQDLNNNVYLISRSGRILWKRPLDNPIIGDVKQIDYYKNGKLQLLFNTKDKLFVVDRNGEDVEKFPMRFPAQATNELSIVDYDNNKNFRFFVACDNKRVYLFDKYGKKVSGWKFKKTDHNVVTPIQHFSVKGKDYIVFKDQYRIYIQDRRGRTRIALKEHFPASINNYFYLAAPNKYDKDYHFVTTDTAGIIKKIYFTGTVTSMKISTTTGDNFFSYEDFNCDGIQDYLLVVKDKLIACNADGQKFMTYQFDNKIKYPPFVYEFSSTIRKVGVVDVDKNSIYLINADGSLHKGFPLRGCTPFSVGFMADQNWRFNLSVGGVDNYMYNYIIN